jgi:Holliday junction resolvasome RuvABC ATP-dependent DNA helicase subunit
MTQLERLDPNVWARQLLQSVNHQPYNGGPVIWFGQEALIKQINPFMTSSDPFPHTILLGEPGLGKTHLARYVAYERNEAFEELLAPTDPMSMPAKGIVLLDEVHRQRSPEPLFQLMAQDTPTIFAATTRPELVDRAFRSRFFLELHLRPYTPEAMSDLIGTYLDASDDVLELLGAASAGNPRQAEKIALVAKKLDTTDPGTILATCQITADGLTTNHIDYLKLLDRMNRPIGVSQIVTLLYADETTVKTTERLLLDYELIQLSQTGRTITRAGSDYMKAFNGQS